MKLQHPRADLYRQERAQGKTYQEIAKKYGVSHQAVSQACRQWTGQGFQVYSKQGCIYPNLRKWLNENHISRSELVRRLGLVSYHTSITRMGDYLRGRYDPPTRVIDKLLQITGLPYEVLFYREKTEEENTNDNE